MPLRPGINQDRVLLPATVLASWFDAPVQIVCQEPNEIARLQTVADGLGVRANPVVCLEQPPYGGIVGYASDHSPAVIVAECTPPDLEIASNSNQPVLLVAEGLRHRLPVGPLVVEITGEPTDLDALALSTTLAKSLGLVVRLVAGPASSTERLAYAANLARQMGCEVQVEVAPERPWAVERSAGGDRGATAFVMSRERVDEPNLVIDAVRHGISVLVCPPLAPDLAVDPFEVNGGYFDGPPSLTRETLSRFECLARLGRHTVARLAHVDAGGPAVVPVNYRLHGGEVFIRTWAGGDLTSATSGEPVCLQLDGHDERLRTGWSVTASGKLEVIGDPATLSTAWANDPRPWIVGDASPWLRFVLSSVAGVSVAPHS